MKNLLLLIAIVIFFSNYTLAQCTPQPFAGGGLTSPDTTQGIAPAAETQPYTQVIQMRIPEDTVYNGAVIVIDSVGIIDITGMPTSFTWATNEDNNFWPGDTNGCIIFQGTPVIGDAGTYTIIINVEIHALGTSLPYTLEYDFEVLDVSHVGIEMSAKEEFQLYQNKPNPFDVNTTIEYFMPIGNKVVFKVYDIVGNCVIDKYYSAQKGKNTISFNRGELSNGIYIYELINANSIIRKKMIIK